VTTAYSLGFAACEERREPVYGVDGVTQVVVNNVPLTRKAAPDSALILSLLTSLVTGLYTVGERLLWCRTRMGWTTREVLRRTGVSASTVSRAERGIGDPTFSGAVKLARAYGVSLDWLATGRKP